MPGLSRRHSPGRRQRMPIGVLMSTLTYLCLMTSGYGQFEDEEEELAPAQPAPVLVAQQASSATAPSAAKPAATGTAAPSGGPATAASNPNAVSVTNIEDKEFKAAQAELQDAKLIVKSDPPQAVPLNELYRVAFTHETRLSAEWVGQVNRDLVQVGAVEEGNGIRDVHIRVAGLAAKNLTQVTLVSRPQFKVWRKDVSRSPFWKIAVERTGQASKADLYFEPPSRDLFETDLELTLTFEDNTTAKATVKATGHTSDGEKVDVPEGGTAAPVRRVSVQLDGTDTLKGRLLAAKTDQIVLETAWSDVLDIPLAQVRGLSFDGMKPEAKAKFDELFSKPSDQDVILVLSKDGGLTEIKGKLQSLGEAGLKVLYEDQERTIKLERVQGVVLGTHSSAQLWKEPYQVFRMASGDLISAQWQALGDKTLQMKTPWGIGLEVPREAVVEVTGRNTKMVNVSEMTPTSVEQVPFFDRTIPWVRDKAWNNRPIRLDDKTYNRGLAVHARCVLTYDLAGNFATFRSIVGFDEEAGDRGRVICRVLVDGKEAFSKPDFRSTEKAVPVEVAVKGARELRLEVDFGEDEDVGDRVIWANARLYRE